MKDKIAFIIIVIISGVVLLGGRTVDYEISLELRPDSGQILFVNRTHDTLSGDTLMWLNDSMLMIVDTINDDTAFVKAGEIRVDTVTSYLKGEADSAIISDTAHYAENSLDSSFVLITADSANITNARIDSLLQDLNLTGHNLDSVDIITADSGNIDNLAVTSTFSAPEIWVVEERVDTIYAIECPTWGNGVSFYVFPDLSATQITLNDDADGFIYGLSHITADSFLLDSVGWRCKRLCSNTDSIAFGYIWDDNEFAQGNTVVLSDTNISDINYEKFIVKTTINQTMTKQRKRYFPCAYVIDTSDKFYITHLILYYHAYNKRLGIPE
jgi:hypothetical protein